MSKFTRYVGGNKANRIDNAMRTIKEQSKYVKNIMCVYDENLGYNKVQELKKLYEIPNSVIFTDKLNSKEEAYSYFDAVIFLEVDTIKFNFGFTMDFTPQEINLDDVSVGVDRIKERVEELKVKGDLIEHFDDLFGSSSKLSFNNEYVRIDDLYKVLDNLVKKDVD